MLLSLSYHIHPDQYIELSQRLAPPENFCHHNNYTIASTNHVALCQNVIWNTTNFWTGPLAITFSEMCMNIQAFTLEKKHLKCRLKISSILFRPQCVNLVAIQGGLHHLHKTRLNAYEWIHVICNLTQTAKNSEYMWCSHENAFTQHISIQMELKSIWYVLNHIFHYESNSVVHLTSEQDVQTYNYTVGKWKMIMENNATLNVSNTNISVSKNQYIVHVIPHV